MKSSIRPVTRRVQAGFTMIELIVVIVILGILAATALPKFIDLRSDATAAATNGVAGNLASAMSVNYAGCSATNHDHSTTNNNDKKCTKVENCQDAASLLQGVTATSGTFTLGSASYTITSASLGTTVGDTATCTLTNGSNTATFTGIKAGT